MIFQVFATIVLAGIGIYAYSQGSVAPHLKYFTIAVLAAGEYLVLFPGQTTVIASYFGVGRGADLLFYFWILISLVMVLNVHLRIRALNDKFVALTRQLALAEAAAQKYPALSDGPQA